MTDTEIIQAIHDNSLTVRCLPYEVVSLWSYREGDEERNITYPGGGEAELVEQVLKNGKVRKLWKTVRQVESGAGWWFVKETKNTSSQVHFNMKHDKYFAPTLKEAIELYLEDKNANN